MAEGLRRGTEPPRDLPVPQEPPGPRETTTLPLTSVRPGTGNRHRPQVEGRGFSARGVVKKRGGACGAGHRRRGMNEGGGVRREAPPPRIPMGSWVGVTA